MRRLLSLLLLTLLISGNSYAARNGCQFCNAFEHGTTSCDAYDYTGDAPLIANCSTGYYCWPAGGGLLYCEYRCEGNQCYQV
jgi:hypothetical protein